MWGGGEKKSLLLLTTYRIYFKPIYPDSEQRNDEHLPRPPHPPHPPHPTQPMKASFSKRDPTRTLVNVVSKKHSTKIQFMPTQRRTICFFAELLVPSSREPTNNSSYPRLRFALPSLIPSSPYHTCNCSPSLEDGRFFTLVVVEVCADVPSVRECSYSKRRFSTLKRFQAAAGRWSCFFLLAQKRLKRLPWMIWREGGRVRWGFQG